MLKSLTKKELIIKNGGERKVSRDIVYDTPDHVGGSCPGNTFLINYIKSQAAGGGCAPWLDKKQ